MSLRQNTIIQRFGAVTVILLVAAVGTYFLVGSHAASQFASLQAEGGTLAGGATSQACSGASNNNCVLFAGGNNSSSTTFLGVDGADSKFYISPNPVSIFINAGLKWDRYEGFSMPSTSQPYYSPADDQALGLSDLGIIDTDNNTLLSTVNPTTYANYGVSIIKANPGVKIWEVLNEAYYKGGVADPISYGKLYLALYNKVTASNSGITGVTLLFNMWGDYQLSSGSWSDAGFGGGWLHDAVAANPGLAAAIASEATSTHPYGPIVDPSPQYESGPYAVKYQQQNEQAYLGTVPPAYITEYGIDINGLSAPDCPGNALGEQAYQLTEAYNIFLNSSITKNVKGIIWYQAFSDSNSSPNNGIVDNNGNTPRPALQALIQEEDLKQHAPSCSG